MHSLTLLTFIITILWIVLGLSLILSTKHKIKTLMPTKVYNIIGIILIILTFIFSFFT